MNQETISKYKEIIANAPKGATHWSADTYLQVAVGSCCVYNGLNVWSVPVSNASAVFVYDNPIQLSLMVDIVELWESELRNDRYVMYRARGLIKAHKSTSNARLCKDLFGTGMGTARDRCREMDLDPDSNETPYPNPPKEN